MKISLQELKTIISEMVKSKLSEAQMLSEGPKEIQIRLVMEDIKDIVVSSIADELKKELKMDEAVITGVLNDAFDKMTRDVIMNLDKASAEPVGGTAPRRRVIIPGGTGGV